MELPSEEEELPGLQVQMDQMGATLFFQMQQQPEVLVVAETMVQV
jgi:hypothetical protein